MDLGHMNMGLLLKHPPVEKVTVFILAEEAFSYQEFLSFCVTPVLEEEGREKLLSPVPEPQKKWFFIDWHLVFAAMEKISYSASELSRDSQNCCLIFQHLALVLANHKFTSNSQ